jgi:hypothetical protein
MGKLNRPEIVLGTSEFNLYLVQVFQVRLYGNNVAFRAFAVFQVVEGQLMTHSQLGGCGQHSSANHYKLRSRLFASSKLISNLNRERDRDSHLSFGAPCGCIPRHNSVPGYAGPSEAVGTIKGIAELQVFVMCHTVLSSTEF